MLKVKNYLLLVASVAGLIATPALARVDYAKPAVDDISSEWQGKERVVATAEGGLAIYGESGAVTDPAFVFPNEAIVAGPVLVDVVGPALKDVAVITRNSNNEYYLRIFDYEGGNDYSQMLANKSVYYDPTELKIAGQSKRALLVSTNEGRVLMFTISNNALVETTLVTNAEPVGAVANSAGDELLLTYPNTAKISLYKKNGNLWQLSKDSALASPAQYPATYVNSSLVALVQKNNTLTVLDKTTGALKPGFPVVLGGAPLDSALVAEVNADNAEQEIIAPLTNGTNAVYSSSGVKLSNLKDTRSFIEQGGISAEAGGGVISSVRNFISGVYQSARLTLVSALSKLKFAVSDIVTSPSMQVTVAGQPFVSNDTHNFGVVALGTPARVDFVITNTGNGNLDLTGNPLVALTGQNAADYLVAVQPNATLAPNDSTTLTVEFKPLGGGNRIATISIATNDIDPFVINLNGQSSVPTIVYEDAEDGDAMYWNASPANTASTIKSEADDVAHGRAMVMTKTSEWVQFGYNPAAKTPWKFPQYPVLSWEAKHTTDFEYFVFLNTSIGQKYIKYGTAITPGPQTGIALDPASKDGAWHKFTRNLTQDFQSLYPGANVNSIIYFGSGRGAGAVDNIALTQDANLATLSGTVTDEGGTKLSGVKVLLNGHFAMGLTDQNGKFSFGSVPAGSYTLTAAKPGYQFSSVPVTVTVAGPNVSDISGVDLKYIIYEDAEDGSSARWTPANAGTTSTAAVVVDADTQSNVIELRGSNNVLSFNFSTSLNNPWNLTTYPMASVDVKYSRDFKIFFFVNTSAGVRYMSYSTNEAPGSSGNGRRYAINPAFKDGKWHTITRDLQADLTSLEPGVTITNVAYFNALGNGRIDNLKLLKR